MKNINDYWDKTTYPNDTSQALIAAIGGKEKQSICFPDGVYYLENVAIPNDTRIVCSQDAIMRGVAETSDMLILAGNRIRIEGGRWRAANSAISNDGTMSTSSNLFSKMWLDHIDTCFSLVRCYGNVWRNCVFDHADAGILLREGSNNNHNSIDNCKFDTDEIAVNIQQGHNNTLFKCWFEHCDNIAVRLDKASNTTIFRGWFENNGGLDMPDIEILGRSKQTVISRNRFAGGNAPQTERIKLSGDSQLYADNNYVYLKAGQVFVRIESDDYMSHLLQNDLSSPSGGYYADKLFLRLGLQTVKYDIFVGSNTLGSEAYGEYIV